MYFHKPQEKPRKWGSFQDVQYAVMKNCEKIYGVDPDSIVLAMPLFWGVALDYSGKNNHGTRDATYMPTWNSEGILFDANREHINSLDMKYVEQGANCCGTIVFSFIRNGGASPTYDYYFYNTVFTKFSGYRQHEGSTANFYAGGAGTQLGWNSIDPFDASIGPHSLAFAWDTGVILDRVKVIVNGVNEVSSTPVLIWGDSAAGTTLDVGGRNDSDGRYSNGTMKYFNVFNEYLTSDQIALFHDLPWALYQPVSRPIWSIPAAGEEPSPGPGLMALMI